MSEFWKNCESKSSFMFIKCSLMTQNEFSKTKLSTLMAKAFIMENGTQKQIDLMGTDFESGLTEE